MDYRKSTFAEASKALENYWYHSKIDSLRSYPNMNLHCCSNERYVVVFDCWNGSQALEQGYWHPLNLQELHPQIQTEFFL